MTPINIAVPESLSTQKSELEATLAGIASEEEKLAAQRKEIQAALNTIATSIAVLSGQPIPANKAAVLATTRKPMSEEAKKRIAEGLRKSREAKAAQVAFSVPQAPVPAPDGDLAPDTPRKRGGLRKATRK